MAKIRKKTFVLIICDGWGERRAKFGNAILAASTPKLDAIRNKWPHTVLAASGEAVGLPKGQQGNSEVGHLAIGTGRIIYQPLNKLHNAIISGKFYQNDKLIAAINLAKERGTALHIVGLVSPGGVHSHSEGALALARLAAHLKLDRVYVDAFTDGRDMPPTSGFHQIEEFEAGLALIGVGKIASVTGRYYAMDRDNRWERTELAYNTLIGDKSPTALSATGYLADQYKKGQTDEFIKPVSITGKSMRSIRIEDGDIVVFFNFRADRARQLSHALVDKEFTGFKRQRVVRNLHFVSFVEYDKYLKVPVVFPPESIANSLAEVISKHHLMQYHIAETEKYAHVTYFINGGVEPAFPGENRKLIPSLKVATYDLAPEMRAQAIAENVVEHIKEGKYDLIIANFANADMVGHSGVFGAARQAIEILDGCLGKIVDTVSKYGGYALITADHGNAECMINPKTKQPVTSHTTSPVPVILCGAACKSLHTGGSLRDVMPTILDILHLPLPPEVTGRSLIRN